MWQSLTQDTAGEDFVVVAVALDEAEAARPWIEAAGATYPCLIDREHRLAELYHLTNVPQATWIDEHGRIVRPPENAGSSEGFRRMDRATGVLPDEAKAERDRLKAAYRAALLDWARRGAESPYALDATEVAARLPLPDATVAEAHAHFRLAQALRQEGREAEAQVAFAEASRLHPESWAIWRQATEKSASGLATTPAFWARVDALGDKPYHRPLRPGDPAGPAAER